MSQVTWNADVEQTWRALQALSLDDAESLFPFSARLKKENGWTVGFTRQAIEEYRRFLLLAKHAGHPITPSPVIDQVWHLHLVYTCSYWEDFCKGVLERPLHHHPTSGGPEEGTKFREQYLRTLQSYRALFGEEPPEEFWPSVDECFRPKRERWIDANRHWLIPRPSWWPRLNRHLIWPAALVLGLALTAAGCENWNVFDYRGETFLLFYVLAFLGALALSFSITSLLRRRMGPADIANPISDPYEAAFLGGGGRRMTDALFSALYVRGALRPKSSTTGPAHLGRSETEFDQSDWHHFESLCLKALPKDGTAKVGSIRESLAPLADSMRESMAECGFVYSGKQLASLRWAAAIPLLAVIGTGLAKAVVGVERDRPVTFLVILLIFSAVTTVYRVVRVNRRTPAGQTAWKEVRAANPTKPVRSGQDLLSIDPTAAALLVAIGGSAALKIPALGELHQAIHRHGADTGGGCGTSGCGAGGCGGGGCGGGCGGCGD